MALKVTIQIAMELWGAIFCIIFAIIICMDRQKLTERGSLLLLIILQIALLLICDSVAWMTRGDQKTISYYLVRISNYLVFVLNYTLGLTSLLYMETLMSEKGEKVPAWMRYSVIGICGLGVLEVTISQFTGFLYSIDSNNIYSRGPGYLSICIVAAIMLILVSICLLKCFRIAPSAALRSLGTLYQLTFVSNIVQFFVYGISIVNLSISIGATVMFISYEKDRIEEDKLREKAYLENELRLMQQENEMVRKDAEIQRINTELTEKKTQIMLSQIRPHFLFNSLSAISFLCIKDPKKAKTTIDDFAEFVRTNLDSLTNDKLVTFSDEMKHVKAYLSIESVRFGEDLHVVYDIQYKDFCLPTLTLQPIVENAVRHGICGTEDGGTIVIRSEKVAEGYRIIVTDDGAGFDMNTKPSSDKKHVGVENVRQRLKTMVNGSLTIQSVLGQGTVATILIPE